MWRPVHVENTLERDGVDTFSGVIEWFRSGSYSTVFQKSLCYNGHRPSYDERLIGDRSTQTCLENRPSIIGSKFQGVRFLLMKRWRSKCKFTWYCEQFSGVSMKFKRFQPLKFRGRKTIRCPCDILDGTQDKIFLLKWMFNIEHETRHRLCVWSLTISAG